MRESVEREGEGEGWQTVSRRKKSGYVQNLDKVSTSFFITNFPEEATANDLWGLFLKYGRVREVYIPKKLDKWGRRFGFVKFKEVKDVEAMSASLVDVWLGSFKLRVNHARFSRSEKNEVDPLGVGSQGTCVEKEGSQAGRSFKTALLNINGGGSSPGEQLVIKAATDKSFWRELQGSMVGLLACEKDVKRIQTTLYMEGYRSISVTNMGSNMVLLRSPVAGDVEKLMRSKNECLKYYFSELKPWVSGIVAKQREIWVQVLGIPLHIWGDEFFKQLGAKFGVFLDYDDATTSRRRLDVARLKILTDIWTVIDAAVKVEVDSVIFEVWVVEERCRERCRGSSGEGVLDEGSRVAQSVASGGLEVEYGGDAENSGEDDVSVNDPDGDGSMRNQHGVSYEVVSPKPMREEETIRRNEILMGYKSTKIPNSFKETDSVGPTFVCCVDGVIGQGEVVAGLVTPTLVVENDMCPKGGAMPLLEREIVIDPFIPAGGSLGLVCVQPDPLLADPYVVGLNDPIQNVVGPSRVEEELRLSSMSEPEEVFQSHREKFPNRFPKSKRQSSNALSKSQLIGAPKCVRFLEAVKDGFPRNRRRRGKEEVGPSEEEEVGSRISTGDGAGGMEERVVGGSGANQRDVVVPILTPVLSVTPSSGLNLISNSVDSLVRETPSVAAEGDRVKVMEAAKLLAIQKETGFSFDVNDNVTIAQLIQHEVCDREKKVEWEIKNGDQ
jgi:hypothetical protein